MAISPTGGVFSYLPHHLDLASEDSVGHSTCMSVLARRRAIMGSIVQSKRSIFPRIRLATTYFAGDFKFNTRSPLASCYDFTTLQTFVDFPLLYYLTMSQPCISQDSKKCYNPESAIHIHRYHSNRQGTVQCARARVCVRIQRLKCVALNCVASARFY